MDLIRKYSRHFIIISSILVVAVRSEMFLNPSVEIWDNYNALDSNYSENSFYRERRATTAMFCAKPSQDCEKIRCCKSTVTKIVCQPRPGKGKKCIIDGVLMKGRWVKKVPKLIKAMPSTSTTTEKPFRRVKIRRTTTRPSKLTEKKKAEKPKPTCAKIGRSCKTLRCCDKGDKFGKILCLVKVKRCGHLPKKRQVEEQLSRNYTFKTTAKPKNVTNSNKQPQKTALQKGQDRKSKNGTKLKKGSAKHFWEKDAKKKEQKKIIITPSKKKVKSKKSDTAKKEEKNDNSTKNTTSKPDKKVNDKTFNEKASAPTDVNGTVNSNNSSTVILTTKSPNLKSQTTIRSKTDSTKAQTAKPAVKETKIMPKLTTQKPTTIQK